MAFIKPTGLPVFAEDDVTLPVAGTDNKVQPSTLLQTQGYDIGTFPSCEEFNWQMNKIGQWVEYLDDQVGHLVRRKLYVYDRRNTMRDDTDLSAGDFCSTLGYYEQGDGGDAFYEIKTTGSPDSSKVISLDNGLFAHFIYTSNVIKARQFGARGDGSSDDTSFLQRIIDLPEDESNDIFAEGITVDLQGLEYLVSGITFQNKTTIKNGKLSQLAAGDNILEHVEGSTKSNGWSHLYLDNVTFDGRGLGSGAVSVDDQVGGYTLVASNTALYVNVSTTSNLQAYKIIIDNCIFTDIYNSNITISNTVSNIKSLTVIENSEIQVTSNVDNLKIHNIFIGSINNENSTTFRNCKSTSINGAYIYDLESPVVFDNCVIDVTDNPSNAIFLGDTNVSIVEKSNITVTGASINLTKFNYKLTISNSTISSSGNLNIISTHDLNQYSTFKATSSNFNDIYFKREGNGGTRTGVNISISGCDFNSLDIEPSDATNEPLGVNYDLIRLTNTNVDTRFRLFFRSNSQDVRVMASGNHLVTPNNPMITAPGAAPEAFTLSGNMLSGNTTIISTPRTNVDTGDYYAVLENITEGVSNLVLSSGDATTVTAKYQA